MSDDIHGTSRGVYAHSQQHEHLCLPCAAFEVDKGRAWRIRRGKAKEIRLSTLAVGRILSGANAAEVLAGELGPHTFEALRTLGGGQRG